MNTNVFKIDFSNQISHISREREREREREQFDFVVIERSRDAETGEIGKIVTRLVEKRMEGLFSDIERSRDAETKDWRSSATRLDSIFYYSNQIIHKNNVVNDLGMYKTKSNFYHWQKNKMPEAYCFEFFNNVQNTQTTPYKQPQ